MQEVRDVMLRLLKWLLVLAVLAGLGFVAFALLGPVLMPGEFAPPQTEITQPVTLEFN